MRNKITIKKRRENELDSLHNKAHKALNNIVLLYNVLFNYKHGVKNCPIIVLIGLLISQSFSRICCNFD